jgi:hypothetical protein
MERGGLGVVRRDAAWEVVEPRPPARPGRHVYRWQATDRMVRALASHGLRWYPIVDSSPPGRQAGGEKCSVRRRATPTTWPSRALAARYGRDGSFWRGQPRDRTHPVKAYEIWNEPNTSFFWRPQKGAPERYATLYRAARHAIRDVDPRARVVVGGLTTYVSDATPAPHFLRRMAARLGGLGEVDAVGLHPSETRSRRSSVRFGRRARQSTSSAARGYRWTSPRWAGAPRERRRRRARWLARLARDLPRSRCRVEVLLPHSWLTDESDRAQPGDWFGIANKDGSLKPSGRAYLRAARSVERAKRARPTYICT